MKRIKNLNWNRILLSGHIGCVIGCFVMYTLGGFLSGIEDAHTETTILDSIIVYIILLSFSVSSAIINELIAKHDNRVYVEETIINKK